MRAIFHIFEKLTMWSMVFFLILNSSLGVANEVSREKYETWLIDSIGEPISERFIHRAPESLCDLKNEIISYTCKLDNSKIVSVCISRNFKPENAGTGYIVYRYGLPRKVELVYPRKLQRPENLFSYSSLSSNYEYQTSLSFIQKPYSYTVFSHHFWKRTKWISRDGISVRVGRQVVFQKMCQGNLSYTTENVGFPPLGFPPNYNYLPQDGFVDLIDKRNE